MPGSTRLPAGPNSGHRRIPPDGDCRLSASASHAGHKRTVGLSPHSCHSQQIIAVFRLPPIIQISGFLIFVLPVANITPRSQIRLALLIEVWMLETAVIR